MRRLRDFASITALFSDREIDELQAAADVRREARAGRGGTSQDSGPGGDSTQAGAAGSGPPKGGGVQGEARDGGLREDAKRLLRVSYERQVAGGGRVTHVDLGAGAEDLGMDARGARLGALLDYMGGMDWVEEDLFARDAPGATVRRVTPRGLVVVWEA